MTMMDGEWVEEKGLLLSFPLNRTEDTDSIQHLSYVLCWKSELICLRFRCRIGSHKSPVEIAGQSVHGYRWAQILNIACVAYAKSFNRR